MRITLNYYVAHKLKRINRCTYLSNVDLLDFKNVMGNLSIIILWVSYDHDLKPCEQLLGGGMKGLLIVYPALSPYNYINKIYDIVDIEMNNSWT